MRLIIYISTIALLATFFSCNRLKKDGQEAILKTKEKIGETKQKINDRKDKLVENLFPMFDKSNPDSESNKKRFKEYLKVELSKDIKNIYTFGDFIGIDYKVLISFNCDTATLNKIVSTKEMLVSTTKNDEGLLFLEEYPWWNKKVIAKIIPFKVGKEYEY